MDTRRAWAGLLLLALLAWSAILGCREEVPPLFRRNRPPETTLTVVAEPGTAAFYRYHVYWRGEDPDGEVVRFLFAITDTLSPDPEQNWDPSLAVDRERGVYTTKSDSIFYFDSNAGRQVFNIVAIDDYGEFDPSPARSYFLVVDNGLPRVTFLDVTTSSPDPAVLPCVAALPCTVPTYTNFALRFVGTSANGAVTGYTWQPNLGLWEPYYTVPDTFFLETASIDSATKWGTDPQGRKRWRASSTATGVSADGDSIYRVDSITVYTTSTRESPATPGNFTFRVRVRDEARRNSLLDKGFRSITVNYDPDTRLYIIPECDCPPYFGTSSPRPGCSSSKHVPIGFITGIGLKDSFALEDWQIFCPGDTLPLQSRVRFFSTGWDDRRDLPKDEVAGLDTVRYQFRFEYGVVAQPLAQGYSSSFSSTNMTFSLPPAPQRLLEVPGAAGGGTFPGAAAGWRSCPFDYRFEAGAVDEQGKVDGTAAAIDFFVSGAPTLDSIIVPKVVVFLPKCPDLLAPLCPWNLSPPTFGPDTLAVLGKHKLDEQGATPLKIGFNEFLFPLRAIAHDHPRDRNPAQGPIYYSAETIGRIRAWLYTFNCNSPNCIDYQMTNEGRWREDIKADTDPPGREVFDDSLFVEMTLDTLCTVPTPPNCPGRSLRAILSFERFGSYQVTMQGRDTEFVGQTCPQPSDLGREPSIFTIPIAEFGRVTQVGRRTLEWRQYSEVRRVATAATTSGGGGSPFAIPKRLMP